MGNRDVQTKEIFICFTNWLTKITNTFGKWVYYHTINILILSLIKFFFHFPIFIILHFPSFHQSNIESPEWIFSMDLFFKGKIPYCESLQQPSLYQVTFEVSTAILLNNNVESNSVFLSYTVIVSGSSTMFQYLASKFCLLAVLSLVVIF